jgi:predicted trehalose synthase
MTLSSPPRYKASDRRRYSECESRCREALSKLINEATELGWRREELAIHLADAADDYVWHLATMPQTPARS